MRELQIGMTKALNKAPNKTSGGDKSGDKGGNKNNKKKNRAKPRPAASDGRALALRFLALVLRKKQPLDQGFAGALAAGPGLDTRDRAFARLLVLTTLRRLGQIDAVIDHFLERPLARAAALAQDALRLGAAQLLFLGTAPHAAVDGSVRLAAATPHRALVNAVLRRIAREGAALVAAQDAARLDTPPWLWARWCETYGEATTRAMAAVHLAEPPLDISVKDPAEAALWAARLAAQQLPTGTLRRAFDGPIEALPGYDAGQWWVQDAAAALPAKLLRPMPGERAIDLCAAPGGKTAALAAAGAVVTAIDRAPPRLARLTANLARLNLTATVIAADAAAWRPEAPAPAVLLDAPCSATGTLRRRPDVAYAKRAADLGPLTALQARLLKAAAAMVAPGGRLVYCVCSLEPEEGPAQIAAFLAATADFALDAIAPEEVAGRAELLTADGMLRTLPCHFAEWGGMDGFFAARMLRKK